MYFTKKISITGDNLLVGLRTFTDTWSSQSIVFSLIDAADTTLLNEILTNTGTQSAVYTSNIPISGNYNSQGTTLNKYFGELSGVPTGEYFLVLTSTTNNTGNFIMNYLSIINIKDGE